MSAGGTGGEDAAMTPELARLLRVWVPGERCRAILTIYYSADGFDVEVKEGARGTVERVHPSRVLLIRWDAVDKVHGALLRATSPECVDPLPEGQA